MYAVHIKKMNGEVSTFNDVNTMSVSSGRIIMAVKNHLYTYKPKEISEIRFCWNGDQSKIYVGGE